MQEFKETETTEERMAYAKIMSELTDFPIAVDPIDERTLKDCGIVLKVARCRRDRAGDRDQVEKHQLAT